MIKNLGHFSQTNKMPCPSYSLSAFDCVTTDPLCLKYCYAKKHHYNFKVVKTALEQNKNKYMLKNWVNDFSFYIKNILDLKYFRWFDSGDLPNITMLEKICKIADKCPDTLFWLPTRRIDLLTAYFEANNNTKLSILHPNLIIRLSAKDINTYEGTEKADLLGVNISTVTDKKDYTCSAKDQGGKCQSCRKCWNRDVKEVRYALH